MRSTHLAILAAIAGVFACSTPDEGDPQGEQALRSRTRSTEVATELESLRLYDGYFPSLDHRVAPCVERVSSSSSIPPAAPPVAQPAPAPTVPATPPASVGADAGADASPPQATQPAPVAAPVPPPTPAPAPVPAVSDNQQPRFTVGSPAERFDLTFIDTSRTLTKELTLDVGLGLKLGVVAVENKFHLLKAFRESSTSLHLLIQHHQSYAVSAEQPIALNARGKTLLSQGIDAFIRGCGTGFVSSVTYGGELTSLIRLDTSDVSKRREVSNTLGVAPGSKLPFNASISSGLKKVAESKDVHFSVTSISRGAQISGSGLVTGGVGVFDGLDAEAFTRLYASVDKIREVVGKSVRTDFCRDSGSGCEAQVSTGYETNTQRAARPMRASFVPYDMLPALAEHTAAFEKVREEYERAEKTLAVQSEPLLQARVVSVGELDSFLNASQESKPGFNTAPPAAAKTSVRDLTKIAQAWYDKLAVDGQGARGSEVLELETEVNRCWDGLLRYNTASCLTDSPGFRKAVAALDAYRREGRIVPLAVSVGRDAVYFEDAQRRCQSAGYRLASKDEAARLLPYAAHLPGQKLWFRDTACSKDSGLIDGALGSLRCGKSGMLGEKYPYACVPPEGLVRE